MGPIVVSHRAHIAVGCSTMCVFDSYTGSLVGKLTLAQGQGGLPAWSPDGSRLAVFAPRSPFILSTMGPDTSDPRVLVRRAPGFLAEHPDVLIAEQSGWKDRELSTASCSKGYVVPNPSVNTGLVSDCRALIDIRDDLRGDGLVNWGPGTPIEQWEGITVEEVCGPLQLPWGDGCVKLVSLFSFGILFGSRSGDGPELVPREPRVTELSGYFEGTISPSIANLRRLKRLDLSYVRGAIPAEIGSLRELREVRLEGIQGRIPGQLGRLFYLRTLTLGGRLEGHIPPQLGALKQLRTLSLSSGSNAGLTGGIPKQLGGLGRLQQLDLSNNRLTGGVPASLGNLTQLRLLDLSDNQLGGSVPPELGNLRRLQTLSLEGNTLSGRAPSELGATHLEQLSLPLSLEPCLPAELAAKGQNLQIRPTGLPLCVADTYTFRVDESTPIGHAIGVLEVSDEEIVTHTITSGNQRQDFVIDPASGEITVSASLDREKVSSYLLSVEARTTNGKKLTATVTILVTSRLEVCSWGIAVPNPERNPGLVNDCVALLVIGDRLLEENPWTRSLGSFLNWRPDTPIMNWRGVGVGGNPPRVRTLDLEGGLGLWDSDFIREGIRGPIPPELGELGAVWGLQLSSGSTGEIPQELGEMPNLRVLRLPIWSLTGCIPSSLRDIEMTRIWYLDVMYCEHQ